MDVPSPIDLVPSSQQLPHPANPFASPSTDSYNPLRYIASNTLTGIAFTLYMLCALIMSVWMWRRGARWMAAMVIGAYTFSAGLALRFKLHFSPESMGIYIGEYILIVLSPCAFIAANYVLVGRLARHLNMDQHLLVKPRILTRMFVSSDVSTFLIQLIGGTISISGSTSNQGRRHAGARILLTGLALQFVSFFIFTLLFLRFLVRMRIHAPHVWNPFPAPVWWCHWRTLSITMCVSCIGILIRSAYRTVELSQGFQGPLSISEGFFYGLDTFPLLLAIIVYIPFWPGQFINEETASAFAATEKQGSVGELESTEEKDKMVSTLV